MPIEINKLYLENNLIVYCQGSWFRIRDYKFDKDDGDWELRTTFVDIRTGDVENESIRLQEWINADDVLYTEKEAFKESPEFVALLYSPDEIVRLRLDKII